LALEAISYFESKMAKVDVELELSNMRCVQLKEREKNQVAEVENRLEVELEELKTKYAALETEKSSIEAKLEKFQDNVLGLCNESFN